mmetsp:Transcript_7202/g.10969  ORF Transcript_7202/g.10969 Transcript_7202/m.10969 type:complete len:579 (-) Transcript_7202:154-1890(-)
MGAPSLHSPTLRASSSPYAKMKGFAIAFSALILFLAFGGLKRQPRVIASVHRMSGSVSHSSFITPVRPISGKCPRNEILNSISAKENPSDVPPMSNRSAVNMEAPQQEGMFDRAVVERESAVTRRKVMGSAALGSAVTSVLLSGIANEVQPVSAQAAEMAANSDSQNEVVNCLFSKCRLELFECLANTACAANLVCLSTCTGKPNEIDCQVHCGDLFQTAAIDRFNDCAISRGKCVPQRGDSGEYPIPPAESLVPNFDMSKFTGDWYISLGANELFDIFDCQLHKFSFDSKKNMLSGDLQWRVATPDGGFITRQTTQTFRQDANQASLLINDGNDFLHYSDNWYIASAQLEGLETDHVLVYYRGINDAWYGYGGAVLYTRQPTMPKALKPVIQEACTRLPASVAFSNLKATNNMCEMESPLIERLEKTTEKVATAIEKEEEIVFEGIEDKIRALEGELEREDGVNRRIGMEVINDLAFFLKGVERDVGIGVKATENKLEGYAKRLGKSLIDAEDRFLMYEKNAFMRLFRSLTMQEQKVLEELEMDVKDVENLLGKTFGAGVSGYATKPVAKIANVASN